MGSDSQGNGCFWRKADIGGRLLLPKAGLVALVQFAGNAGLRELLPRA
jgi:hypothetical protein